MNALSGLTKTNHNRTVGAAGAGRAFQDIVDVVVGACCWYQAFFYLPTSFQISTGVVYMHDFTLSN